MVHIWKVFSDAFGYKWTRQNGTPEDDTIKTWARSLFGQSDEDLLEGARTIIDQWDGNEFPPDLPAFRAYVRMAKDQRLSAERAKIPKIASIPSHPDTAKKWMGVMRKIGTPEFQQSYDDALAEVSADRGW